MTLIRGLDVSSYQGAFDWAALKRAHGLTFGAAKASQGTGYTDADFPHNWASMKAAGLIRMAYHYGDPSRDPQPQAQRFVNIVKPQRGDVLVLDLESANGATGAQVNAWAKAFGTLLRQLAPGIKTVVYVGGYAHLSTGAGLSSYFDLWWYPRYATTAPVTQWPTVLDPVLDKNTTGWPAPHLWQWAESLRTTLGLVDADVSDLTAAQLSGVATAADAPPNQPTEEDLMSSIMVKNPVTGKMWDLASALWSMWTYILQGRDIAGQALATATANQAAIKVLADEQGHNGQAVIDAVNAGVKEAMAGLKITLAAVPDAVDQPTTPTITGA